MIALNPPNPLRGSYYYHNAHLALKETERKGRDLAGGVKVNDNWQLTLGFQAAAPGA